MKLKCLEVFNDLKENVQRKQGEVFEVSQERYDELNKSIPWCIEQVKPDVKKQDK